MVSEVITMMIMMMMMMMIMMMIMTMMMMMIIIICDSMIYSDILLSTPHFFIPYHSLSLSITIFISLRFSRLHFNAFL